MTNKITLEQENAVKRFHKNWLQDAGQVFDENGELLTHEELLGLMASDFDILASGLGVDYDTPIVETREKYDVQDVELYGNIKGAFELLFQTNEKLQDPYFKASALFGGAIGADLRPKLNQALELVGDVENALQMFLDLQLNPDDHKEETEEVGA